MSGENDEVELLESDTDADFESGFSSEPAPAKTQKTEEKPIVETAPKQEVKAEAKPAPESKPVPPKYAKITEEDYESLKAASKRMADFDKRFRDIGGTLGGMQQVVKKLQEATPNGMSVDLPDDAFAELAEDYPELATKLHAVMSKALKNVRGTKLEQKPTETPTEKPEVDQDKILDLIKDAVIKDELEDLEDQYPNWQELTGAVEDYSKHDPNHPFRKWLASKDQAYQDKVNSTNSARVTARAIDKFLSETKAEPKPKVSQAPMVAARKDRIASAVTPRGDGGSLPPPATADDEFLKGFATG